MYRNPILCAVSPVSQNLHDLCGQYLNDFYIFLAEKYASFRHSAYYRNNYGRLSHLREKFGKSPPEILSIFHFAATQILTEYFFLVHMSRHIMETTGWYLSIGMCSVLVYCCLGMLMTSCFWGAKPILGHKRISYRNHTENSIEV